MRETGLHFKAVGGGSNREDRNQINDLFRRFADDSSSFRNHHMQSRIEPTSRCILSTYTVFD